MLAIAALVLVVIGHGGRRGEATAALAFGLFLATVGIEQAFATQRYSFGLPPLMSGIPLVPMVIGLFAVSEAIVELSGAGPRPQKVVLGGGLFQGFAEVFRSPRTLFGSSAVGIITGIMPGVGEFLAQQVNYTWARKLSKTPEAFGKGHPEEIIGSYASNYSVRDCAIAAAFGWLGAVLRRHRWPLTPILLGLVMGPIVENRMRQALGGANGDFSVFVTRPISAMIVGALALLIVLTLRASWKARRPRPEWQINDT